MVAALGSRAPVTRMEGEAISPGTSRAFGNFTPRPRWANQMRFACSGDCDYLLTPEIRKVWFYDASATTYTDYTDEATDKSGATHVTLSDMTSSDYLYIGFDDVVTGIAVYVDAVNGTGSRTMAIYYLHLATWTDASVTDGTASGGATLAQDGLCTFTLPSSWTEGTVNGIEKLFWIRVSVSGTIDSSVTLDQIQGLYRNTNYARVEASGGEPREILFDTSKVGGIELLAPGGTPNVDIEWIG